MDPLWYESILLQLEVPLLGQGWDPLQDVAGHDALPWDHPGRAFERAGDNALTVTVWDHDSLGADDFLGQLVVRPEQLLRPQNGTHWPLQQRSAIGQDDVSGFLELHVRASHVSRTRRLNDRGRPQRQRTRSMILAI